MHVEYYDTEDRYNEHNRWAVRDTDYMVDDRPEICLHCGEVLDLTGMAELVERLGLGDYVENRHRAEQPMRSLELRRCTRCKWWHVYRYLYDTEGYDLNQVAIIHAIMKRFDISSQSVPLNELARYLATKIDDVYHIHHNKMEELVGAVLREHFQCEVIHCGRSHDRGIDLLLVQGDQLIPVQVKRRMKPGGAEGVKVVREMLGVMLRDQTRSSIIVTSAERFSREAASEANEVKENRLVDRFDLIDLKTLHGIMKNYFGSVTLDPFQKIKQMCSVR